MNNWVVQKLDTVIDFNPSESIPKNSIAKKIAMEKLQPFSKFIYDYEKTKFKGGTKFRNGDTLVARITPCLENGKTSQVSILDQDEIGFGSTEYIVMRAKEGITDKDYIFYLALSPQFRSTAIKSMVGSSGRQRVQTDVIKNMEWNLPPLPTQRRIAAILSSLDDKIENNRRVCEKLEEMAQAIFKQWFVDFNFPDENGEPYKDNGGEMVESELGLIPKGWEVAPLSRIASLVTTSVKPFNYPDTIWHHFSIPAFDDGKESVLEEGNTIKSGKYEVPNNSVLVSKLNPRFPRIWLPDLKKQSQSICSTEFMPFIPKNESELPYLYNFFVSPLGQNEITTRVTGSTGSRQRVRPKDIESMETLIPKASVRNEYSKLTIVFIERIKKINRETIVLKKLRDTLLPKLMSREIEVEGKG